MLNTFADHLYLAQKAWAWRILGWDEVMKPAKLASMLVFSFLQDVEEALLFSEYTYPPLGLHSVGNLQRIERGRIIFSPHPLLYHEAHTRQFLLDGTFWKTLCRVDREEDMFFVPLRSCGKQMSSTAQLRAAGECMLAVIQRYNSFLRDISFETLWRGLSLAIHDAICGGGGIYLEKIGTFFPSCHFDPDQSLLDKIKGENSKDCRGQLSLVWPENGSRRKTRNRGCGL